MRIGRWSLRSTFTTEAVRPAATATVGALLGATLEGCAQTTNIPPLLEAAELVQIHDFIEANLSRPDLTVDLLASRMGVSRGVLYRMFEPRGGTARIQQRRLLAMRRASTG